MPPANQRKSYYPDSSTPYSVYLSKPAEESPVPLSNGHAIAMDTDESPDDFKPRPTYLKVGILSQVKGSAYIEYGNTKVIAAVLPPRELAKQTKKGALGLISCELKYAQFASRSQNLGKKEKSLSVALRKALEPVVCRHEFPNFQIDIIVYVLQDDGCALSTAINCCGAALAEGGIPVYDVITSSTISIFKGKVFVNPKASEEDFINADVREEGDDDPQEHGSVIISTLASTNQIAECYQKGYITYETLERLISHAVNINESILNTVKHVLVSKVQRHLKNDSE